MATQKISVFSKDPDSVLDWEISWARWLADAGDDTIVEATAFPNDVESGLVVELVSHTDVMVTVWVSGGVLGKRDTITLRITTAAGRVEDFSFLIIMKAK